MIGTDVDPERAVSTPATASEPVSVSSGIIGLIAASNQTHSDLGDLQEASAEESTAIASAARAMKSFKLTVQMLFKFMRRLELGTLRLQQRAVLIDIDVLVAALTEAILVVSELGNQLVDIMRQAEEQDASLTSLEPRYEGSMRHDAHRIWAVEAIITKLVNVLEVGSELEALRYRAQVEEGVTAMLECNSGLAGRMDQLQDIFGAMALVPQERRSQIPAVQAPPGYYYSLPADDGGLLPDYAAATATPPTTSTADDQEQQQGQQQQQQQQGTWSIFSGLAVTDVRLMALVYG